MKIKNIQIRKALIQNKKLNPFSDNFDKAEVIALLKEIENERENLDDIDLKLINTIKVTFVLNSTFIETFEYLKSIIYDINLSVDEIIDYCLAFVNRNAILVRKMAVDELSSKKDGFNLADSHKFKINSLDDSIGQISAASALESNIDALNILLNFSNYHRDSLFHFQFLIG